MLNFPVQKASLEVPPFPPRAGAKESREPPWEHAATASTSSTPHDSASESSDCPSILERVDSQSAGFAHYSVSALLGISDPRPTPSGANDKPKGEMARSLVRMLVGSQKAPDIVPSDQLTDVHNLIPYGDVVGLLGINVKQCKDFTVKFNVKHDIYLLIRISIDKIMKCTNPQVYRASQAGKKNYAVYFGDVRYFSVKVPKQKSDSRNRIVLELVGFEGPRDFPRLFGKITVHLYDVIQKQSFTETCAMRIRNMVFCTVEVEFMFCYGCFGYGYSHQLKLPGTDPAQAVAYSMFLRVPPPEHRRDHISNVIMPQRMDYPAFLSPDLNVTVGNFQLEAPTEISEDYKKLQEALQEPPRERLEQMKQEYRSLKTWHDKAEYLDQLILKRGPKTIPGQATVSRFKEIVQKIHSTSAHGSVVISGTGAAETLNNEQVTPDEIQEWASVPQDVDSLTLLNVELSQPVPSQEEAESDTELQEVHDVSEATESYPIPTLTITASATCSPVSSENLDEKFVRQQIGLESETSCSGFGGVAETGDSEGPAFESKVVDEEPPVTPRKESIITEYLPEQMQESGRENVSGNVSDDFVAPEPSGTEAQQEWPWKVVEFQEAVFSGSKFEPFLRNICRVPAPFPSKANEVPDFCNLEDTQISSDIKEQEDQDPPYEMSLAEIHTSPSDTKLGKSGEQLSILRLIESNMEFDEEEQQDDDKEPKSVKTDFIQKSSGEELSVAEVRKKDISFRRSLEDVLVDRLVKVVALKSLLSKNIESIVSEKLSETEISQESEKSNLPNAAESLLGKRETCLLKEGKLISGDKRDIKNLKDIVSQNLQTHLIGKLSEQQIIPDMGLAGNDQKVSFPSSDDLVKRSKDLTERRTSLTETTLKSLSQSGNSSKTESIQNNQEGQSVITKTDLSESKIDVSMPALPLKSHSSSLERINAKDFKTEHSKKSLEIIRVLLPSSTETELTQDKMEQFSKLEMSPKSNNDALIEKLLKEEVMGLKSCLSKRLKDQHKDKLPETGLRTKEDTKTMSQKLSLSMNGEKKMEKDLPERGQVSSKEGLAELYATKEMPILSGNIQNIVLEALSENEIVSLNAILSEKTQDSLLERLSNIGLITEKELGKIVENLFSVMAKDTQPMEVKGSDLPEEGQISSLTESLQDRFSEEELKNLRSLLSKLLKEGHRDRLSESEVKGLTAILQKSFEDLPVQNSAETGIRKEVEIKDERHSIPLQTLEKSTSTGGNVGVSDTGKHRSKENKISSAGEKCGLRGENIDFPANGIFEAETSSKETQTSDLLFPPKKMKHSTKKECHRLPNYADKQIPDMPDSKRVESVLKSKPSEESLKTMSEYASSSFLSAHDIGIQTETSSLSKPPIFLSKPPFPVNPQTFLFLHSDPKEEKSANKAHQKSNSKKKSDKSSKKDMASCYQPAVTNPPIRKEGGGSSKESLKEKDRKHTESPSSKLSMTENRKDSKITSSVSGVRKESLKQKSEKKQNKEISPKKSLSKTFALSNPPQQNLSLAKIIPEKSPANKCPASECTKGNTENPGESDDTDVEAFKHLEKAIERALLDLGRAPGGSPSQTYSSRPHITPHSTPNAALMSKESSRSFSTNNSAIENPRNLTSSVSKMLENQEQVSKMAPEQLATVLRMLQRILQQNTRS